MRQRHKHGLGLLRDMLDKRNDGDRRSWLAALIPIVNPPIKGALVMKTTINFGMGAAPLRRRFGSLTTRNAVRPRRGDGSGAVRGGVAFS
ncbi:MAG: hypothetical protein GY811_01940 [Myxococcales bacterium]|nr:hypothetical protein [Myxococcales bacterium]